MSKIRIENFSLSSIKSPTNILNEDELIHWINSLSSSIKAYYTSTKSSLSEIKQDFTINNSQRNLFDLIEENLKEFITDAKAIFLKLKLIHNKSKFIREPNSPIAKHIKVYNNKEKSRYERTNSFSLTKNKIVKVRYESILANLISPSNISKRNSSYDPQPSISFNNNSEKVLLLAKGVIDYLSHIVQLEESVFKKKNDIEENRKQYDLIKSDLMSLAKSILDSPVNNTKGEEINKYHKTNQHNHKSIINKRLENGSPITSNNRDLSSSATIRYSSIMDKFKDKIKVFQNEIESSSSRKNGEVIQIFPINSNINDKRSKLLNKIKEYHTEKRNKEPMTQGKENKTERVSYKNNKMKDMEMTSKDCYNLINQKEKIILILQNDIQLLIDKGINLEIDLTQKIEEKNNKINKLKEKLSKIEAVQYNNLKEISDEDQQQSMKYILIINQLNEEIQSKTNEINTLNQEEEKKHKEALINFQTQTKTLKSLFEKELNQYKEKLTKAFEEAERIKNELKDSNDQLAKCNSSNSNSKPFTYENDKTMINDLIEKERKGKNELNNIIETLNQEKLRLKNDLNMQQNEIQRLNEKIANQEELIQFKEKELIDLNDNYNKQLLLLKNQSQLQTSQQEMKKESEQIELLTSQYKQLHDEHTKTNKELIESKKLILELEEKVLRKSKTIIQMKDQTAYQELQQQLITAKQLQDELLKSIAKKSDEINALQKQVRELRESSEIIRGVMKEKDNVIFELNQRNLKNNELKQLLEADKEKMNECYENKMNELLLAKDELMKMAKSNEQLKNKLSALNIDYQNKCSLLSVKNKQIESISTHNMEKESEIGELKTIISHKTEEIDHLKQYPNQLSLLNFNYIKEEQSKAIVSSDTHIIICDKSFNELQWYLITTKIKNTRENEIENYLNTYWIQASIVNDDIDKFNKFKTEKEIEEDYLNKITNMQTKLIKQIEEKEDEVIKLRKEKKKLSESYSNGNLATSINKEGNKRYSDAQLFSPAKRIDNDNIPAIPFEQYEKVIKQLDKVNNQLAKSTDYINKLKEENKELSKIAADIPKIENNLSLINLENRNSTPFFDEDFKEIPYIPSIRKDQRNFEEISLELKTLLQLLIQEMTYTNKVKKILYHICIVIGFTENECNKMIIEKEKKGGILNLFKKK